MIERYLTIKGNTEKWEVTRRRLQILCSQGKIERATRLGNVWAIPEDVIRPVDNRITTGEYKN